MRAPAGLTKEQRKLKARLSKLQNECDSLGVLSLEKEGLALVGKLLETDSETACWILNLFGLCYFRTGNYARACELHEQDRATCEALGDRAGVAAACGNLGNCYYSRGDYGRAREMHEQARAIFQALGDHIEVATACGNLGNCYYSTGDHGLSLIHISEPTRPY